MIPPSARVTGAAGGRFTMVITPPAPVEIDSRSLPTERAADVATGGWAFGTVARHHSSREHAERGREERVRMPRRELARFEPAADRPDPVAILEAQGRTRVAELLPIRYQRMAASPFAFYRGAAAVMAADLGAGPRTALRVQLCGDAHL